MRPHWRLQERFEASNPRSRWFATLAGLVAVVSIWRGTWLLMDLYVFPSSPVLSSIASIGTGFVLLLIAGWSLEDAA
ncbi:MAG: hypothetical protein ACK4GM_08140 [Tabrizicola sp.]